MLCILYSGHEVTHCSLLNELLSVDHVTSDVLDEARALRFIQHFRPEDAGLREVVVVSRVPAASARLAVAVTEADDTGTHPLTEQCRPPGTFPCTPSTSCCLQVR